MYFSPDAKHGIFYFKSFQTLVSNTSSAVQLQNKNFLVLGPCTVVKFVYQRVWKSKKNACKTPDSYMNPSNKCIEPLKKRQKCTGGLLVDKNRSLIDIITTIKLEIYLVVPQCSNHRKSPLRVLRLERDFCLFEAKNRVIEFDYQKMNMFESIQCSKK